MSSPFSKTETLSMMHSGAHQRLSGRRIVITGGGTGIGRAIAERCSLEGAIVSVIGRRQAPLSQVQAVTGGYSVCADLRDEDATKRAVYECASSMGGLDGLVNAVGVLDVCTLEECNLDRWNQSILANLTAPFLACRAALPFLREAAGNGKSAAIVNIAALAAIMPGVSSAGYSAAKAGLVQYSRTIAKELGPDIRVNSVCPGAVETPMTDGFLSREGVNREGFISRYTLGRLSQAAEVANVVVFLLSNEASCVIGSNFIVDGGRAFQ
ncbi:SDR family NAD(P)-dependent oxidoreductase [Pseudomonas baetica]|uniref:SDR family NAD(P)-dependent oxidoreductase n=1 Tax=Pseudomonas baetica TaxID=674054 RepID=UPI003EE8257F